MKGVGSELVEIEADRNDSYSELVDRAVEALKLPDGKNFTLYKYNTARIPDTDLNVKGSRKKWSLGNYLLADHHRR